MQSILRDIFEPKRDLSIMNITRSGTRSDRNTNIGIGTFENKYAFTERLRPTFTENLKPSFTKNIKPIFNNSSMIVPVDMKAYFNKP